MKNHFTTSLRKLRRYTAHGLYLLCAVGAIALAYSSAANADNNMGFVSVGGGGSFMRDALPRTGGWQGLFCTSTGCELRRARVRIVLTEEQNILDELEASEELQVEDAPLALFHGLDLANGPVNTSFRLSAEVFESNQYRSLRKLGRWQIPAETEALTLSWVKLPEYGGFRYHLGDGATKQFLFRTELEGHYGDDTTPVIHWAGDLDGDGKTDFLVSLPGDSCGYDDRLYLSSRARDGEFVGKAAHFSGSVPACGC